MDAKILIGLFTLITQSAIAYPTFDCVKSVDNASDVHESIIVHQSCEPGAEDSHMSSKDHSYEVTYDCLTKTAMVGLIPEGKFVSTLRAEGDAKSGVLVVNIANDKIVGVKCKLISE
ncbi:MAG: hypothetical protein ACXVB1_15650 [Pseudobdellovibrionaceae bacterium]